MLAAKVENPENWNRGRGGGGVVNKIQNGKK